jgi:hypothetical protein
MSQLMHLPLWLRLEPVLRFDSEGLLELPVPYRSEGFAEDLLDDEREDQRSTSVAAECEDARRRPVERTPERIA